MQKKGKAYLQLLATSHALNHAYQLLTPVIIPAVTLEYGIVNAGLFSLSFFLSYSLLHAASGFLTIKLGRRNTLTFGFALTALAFLAIGFTDNTMILLALFFVAGAGGSTYHPSGFPIISEAYPANRGQALGLHQTGGAVGSFVGPIVTGLLVTTLTWRPTLMIMAIPGLLLAAVLWFTISTKQLSNENTSKQTEKIKLTDWKTYAPIIVFMAAGFVYVLGQRGTDVFANEYFVIGLGIDIASASFLFALLKLAGLFSAPICGKLSDIYDRKKVLIALVLVESVSLFAITITPIMLLFIPCIIFGFAAFGLLAVGEALLADITPEKQRSVIFGLYLTLSFSPTIILSPILFGIAQMYSFSLDFIILSALMPLSIPLILAIRVKPEKQKQCPTIIE